MHLSASATARSLTAEAGQSCYFRTVTPVAGASGGPAKIAAVDPAEAQVLMVAAAYSAFKVNK